MSGDAHMPDWLVIGQEAWDEVERRNQLLVRAVAARHPRSRILFAEIPLRPRDWRRWRRPRVRQVADNVWTLRAIRPLPGRLKSISDSVEARTLQRGLWKLAIEQPLVWTQDPRAEDLLDRLPVGLLVYDLTDDWAAFEEEPGRRAEVQAQIERLGARADHVLACSRSLAEGASAWAPGVRFLPNAVEPPSPDPSPVPAALAALPRPRLGYAGTQHGARLDVGLLAAVARCRPTWSFVLLGPDHLSSADRTRLHGLPNVHHLGVVAHRDVRAHLEALDVCLIPHLVNDFTRSLDPLKLYEYLAAGRPVVATPAGNAPEYDAYVRSADGVDAFVAACEEALANGGKAAAAARRAAVEDATWPARAQELEALLAGDRDPASPEIGGRVDVVVVSFNTVELTRRCLSAVRAQRDVDVRTIVVDNASEDGSAAMVRAEFPEVELIELGENIGFGPANNVAFARCRGEFVLLLNSDAFLEPWSVGALVAAARRHPRAGAVGPRLLNEDGSLQRSAWPFPRAGRLLLEALGLHVLLRRTPLLEDLGTWAHDEERAVDFVIGACVLVRRAALEEIGGFDEGFWLYEEETDLQWRLTARGAPTVFVPDTAVTHVGAASSTSSGARLERFYAGQRRFLEKHGGPVAWPLARLALLLGSLRRREWPLVRFAVTGKAGRGAG